MRPEQLYLTDIVEAADAIQRFVQGVSKEDFYRNDLLFSAVSHKLMIIGEAAAKISDETRKRYPDVPWTSIVGFRNVLVHAYFSADETILWNAANFNAPELRDRIRTVIDQEHTGTD